VSSPETALSVQFVEYRLQGLAGGLLLFGVLALIRLGRSLPYFDYRPELVLVIEDVIPVSQVPVSRVLSVNPLPGISLLPEKLGGEAPSVQFLLGQRGAR